MQPPGNHSPDLPLTVTPFPDGSATVVPDLTPYARSSTDGYSFSRSDN
ncbi:hypothetical protein Tco_1534862, partial [Tanacetum coccineum]